MSVTWRARGLDWGAGGAAMVGGGAAMVGGGPPAEAALCAKASPGAVDAHRRIPTATITCFEKLLLLICVSLQEDLVSHKHARVLFLVFQGRRPSDLPIGSPCRRWQTARHRGEWA